MYGVFLHILADTLGSVAVIVSSLCINYFDFYLADPICCFLISVLILAAAVPFTLQTGRTLTLGLPSPHKQLQADIQKALAEVKGVHEVSNLKIWELAQGEHILTAIVHPVD
jgi:zinc transporter 5/7